MHGKIHALALSCLLNCVPATVLCEFERCGMNIARATISCFFWPSHRSMSRKSLRGHATRLLRAHVRFLYKVCWSFEKIATMLRPRHGRVCISGAQRLPVACAVLRISCISEPPIPTLALLVPVVPQTQCMTHFDSWHALGAGNCCWVCSD